MIAINKKVVALIAVLALTLIHWTILIFHIPIYGENSGWFWSFISKPTGSLLSLITLAILAISVIFAAITFKQHQKYTLFILIFLAVGLQFCFANLENRGVDAIRDRIIYTGHAEFAKVAVKQDSIIYVLSHYEELLSTGELGIYPNTKSPGTLFFYMLTKKVSEINASENELRNKALMLERLRATATYLWPILSCLVLIPIFFLSSLTLGKDSAILACAFYLTVPSINLMTLHTDQVIYPLLFIIPILIAAVAGKKNSILLMFFSGVMAYVAMWFSFALMFSIPFAFGISFFALLQRPNFNILNSIKFYIGFLAGFTLLHILFKAVFNYDFLVRYDHATKFHFAVKGWEGGFDLTLHFALLNLVEFFVWIGIPMALFVLLGFYDSLINLLRRKKVTLEDSLPLLLTTILLFIAIMGKTKAETARLWLFLVPYACIVSAHFIAKKFGADSRIAIAMFIFLQIGTTYLTKINQDFF